MSAKQLFKGELMTCVVCNEQHQSHPSVETEWRALEVDDRVFYACPGEFPPDGSTKGEFKAAYQFVLACCISESLRLSGKLPNLDVEKYRLQRRQARERTKPKGFG